MSIRPLIAHRSPVAGLNRRRLSFLPVFAQSVAAVAPAGSMSVIPALILGSTGGSMLVAFGCATVVALLVSVCLRPMARRMSAVSGLYSYVARGLGPLGAVPAGWSAIFGYALIAMASLLAVGTYGSQMIENLGFAAPGSVPLAVGITLAAAIVTGLLTVRGIRISARVTLFVECTAIVIMLVLMGTYLLITRTEIHFTEALTWDGNLKSTAVGIVIAVSAFVGFESSSTLGGEAWKPLISVPRAITWTPLATGALYLLSVAWQNIALRAAPASVRLSSTPLTDLFSSQALPLLAALFDLGIAASFFACAVASVNALVRVLFCMGRERVAPEMLGRVHPRFATPWVAILAVIPVIAAVPVAVILSGTTPAEGLTNLLMLGAYGYLGSYLLACAASPLFLHRIGEGSRGAWIMGGVTTVILLLIGWEAVGVGGADGKLRTLVYVGFLAAAVVYTLALRWLAPARLAAVGIYDETRESDLLNGSLSGPAS